MGKQQRPSLGELQKNAEHDAWRCKSQGTIINLMALTTFDKVKGMVRRIHEAPTKEDLASEVGVLNSAKKELADLVKDYKGALRQVIKEADKAARRAEEADAKHIVAIPSSQETAPPLGSSAECPQSAEGPTNTQVPFFSFAFDPERIVPTMDVAEWTFEKIAAAHEQLSPQNVYAIKSVMLTKSFASDTSHASAFAQFMADFLGSPEYRSGSGKAVQSMSSCQATSNLVAIAMSPQPDLFQLHLSDLSTAIGDGRGSGKKTSLREIAACRRGRGMGYGST